MGGDYAPGAVVKGALLAAPVMAPDSRIVLLGDQSQILQLLREEGIEQAPFDIIPCTEVIGMDDHPAQAFIKKPDSSIAVGFACLKARKIDSFASAGNTGAMMAGAMMTLKSIEGVIRPGISSLIPATDGSSALLMDVGLNVDCKPDVLAQYGLIGSEYARKVLDIDSPRVALLNIGEEKEKGNLATKAAWEMLEEMQGRIRFVGNIEAKHLFSGHADVIICDGFVGNSMLKEAEGFYEIAKAQGIQSDFIDRMNYELVGGTPVLGINGNVVIGHGCSSPLAIKNMILQTEKSVKAGLVESLRQLFQ